MTPAYSRKEAAIFLGVSVRTLDRLPIQRARIGRRVIYLRADLVAYLETCLEAA